MRICWKHTYLNFKFSFLFYYFSLSWRRRESDSSPLLLPHGVVRNEATHNLHKPDLLARLACVGVFKPFFIVCHIKKGMLDEWIVFVFGLLWSECRVQSGDLTSAVRGLSVCLAVRLIIPWSKMLFLVVTWNIESLKANPKRLVMYLLICSV